MENDIFDFENPLHSYSRAQAIEDGVLVDVSEAAREVGIKFTVAITQAAHATVVAWGQDDGTQDTRGRLHDVVWMLSRAIRRSASGDLLNFSVLAVPNEPGHARAAQVDLKAICGPGDNMEPVITVLLPNED